MSVKGPILLSDVTRLAEAEAPDLVTAIVALIDQGEQAPAERVPDDLVTLSMLRAALAQAARSDDKQQRQSRAQDAWKRYLAQAESLLAPQVKLADLIVALYEKKAGPSRQALLVIAREAPLLYGIWGGLKRVYKRAEADHDAEVWGALACRFDLAANEYMPARARDVQRGTLVYLQRRGQRYLRLLGKAVPEIFPQFAVEVMRSYPLGTALYGASIMLWIERHDVPKWGGTPNDLPKTKTFRPPYRDAWARSPDPLLLLLETCQADIAASFAVRGLAELHPEALRSLTPAFLGRLAYRPLASAHDFVVDALEGSPQLHQGKLRSLGLHEPVLALLVSPSAKARKYAIDYARGHATDLSVDRVLSLLEQSAQSAGSLRSFTDTAAFVASLVMARKPRELGAATLGRLVAFDPTRKWATAALEGEFDRHELGEPFFIDMLFSGNSERSNWARTYLEKKFQATELPMAFFFRVLDDARATCATKDGSDARVAKWAMGRLAALDVGAAPGEWLLGALARTDIGSDVAAWLGKATTLPKGLDLDRIKGLVFDPSRRQVAFTLLGNKNLVAPGQVGLGWLLALARRADPELHEWAHRYLLQHLRPEHFAEGKENAKAGITRLFGLALGAKEPEAVRLFAQTYLRCHHPKIGKDQPESKQLHLKPLVPREAYTLERVWPGLFDTRSDVRRFAVTITRVELRRWQAQSRVYELAESSAKEVRKIAFDALSQAGEDYADPDLALTPEELDAAQIFSMTESRSRSSRDIAIELIRKHYDRIGGAERLGWLMQSADREVRFFAVRLLWEKHRPRGLPKDWRPAQGKIDDAGAFTNAEALRALLRRLLFTVPPPRAMEQLEGARAKKLPASVAKRNLIEIVRDLGLEDATFAALIAPVLEEHTGSIAKGEWQACLSALLTLRSAHAVLSPPRSPETT